jgi:hypothetical protein
VRIRDRLGISERQQVLAVRAMQAVMVLVVGVGVWRGDLKVVVNGGVALGISLLVPWLERDYGVPLDAGLTLWITAAVFLHAFGTIGFPPGTTSFYRTVWWWDHVTHALSSSVVAGVGYATVRALDEHSEDIHLPPKFVFVFILMFVLAYGVFWEILEFALAEGAALLGTDTVLTQYGLTDSLLDLLFNSIGAVVVALWGTAYLNDLSGYIRERLDGRAA